MGMRVELREVEFSCKEEDDGTDRGESSVAAGLTFGGLKEPVQSFKEAIGLPGARPSDDALDVAADHLRHFLHGFNFRAHDVSAPLQQYAPDHVDLLALKNLAQLLPV